MELTNEELDKSCRDNGLWWGVCGQGYMATLADVLGNNPGMDRDEWSTKVTAMAMMLEENLSFGDLEEDNDTDDNHPDRMGARWDILDELAERWISGEYTGKGVPEKELCQKDCTSLAEDWLAGWGDQ